MNYPTRPALLAGLVGSLLLTSCNTTQTTASKPAEAVQTTERTKHVNSLGSWIPRKVTTKADLIGDSAQDVDAQALERIQASGLTKGPKDAGGR